MAAGWPACSGMAFCSMTDPEKPALTADFPQATREDWRKLVDAALKGVPFERLKSKTYDNLSFEPLYGRAAAAKPLTGRPSGAAWTLMQRVDHPEAAAANAQALADLENGATGLVLVFAGSPSANGFGLDPSAGSAGPRARGRAPRRRCRDRPRSVCGIARCHAQACRTHKTPRGGSVGGRPAHRLQPDRRFRRLRLARAILE